MPKRSISSSIISFIEENQKAIVLLSLLLTIIGGLAGYKYYKHTQEDPEFCASCHMMKEAFRTWEMSKHRDIQCQVCHAMTLIEQNRLLVSFVVKGTKSIKQKHGRIKPWDKCKGCHMSDVEQGSLTFKKSYGHARHVFMHDISCSKCHTENYHSFKPNERACAECHKDRMIHGLGMEALTCLNCHNYREKEAKMISNDRCLRCHRSLPTKGIMASLKCFDCHKPHGQIKLTSNDCFKNCHGDEARVGQHNLHMKKTKLGCLDCHKSHKWSVGKEEAVKLCTRCHQLKDPATFIY